MKRKPSHRVRYVAGALLLSAWLSPILTVHAESGRNKEKVNTADAKSSAPGEGMPRKNRALPEVDAKASVPEQLCALTANAALEARYAWQMAKLEELSVEIDQRLAKLDEKKKELASLSARHLEFERRATAQLASIFREMRPESASEHLQRMEPVAAAALLSKLEPKVASAILNDMSPDKASSVTGILAAAAGASLRRDKQ